MKGSEAQYIEDAIRDLDSAIDSAAPSLETKVDATCYLVNSMAQAMVILMTDHPSSTVRKAAGPLLMSVGVQLRDLYGKDAMRTFLDAWTGGEYTNVSEMKKSGISNKDIEEFLKKGKQHDA